MNRELLERILDDIKSVNIAVIGDFCLDAYWFIDESGSEISVETGLGTNPVRDQRYSLGGAGNVTANLKAMGAGGVRAFGVIGSDPFGSEMVRIMEIDGIDSGNLLTQEDGWCTHTYAKPYAGDRELNRMDYGNFNRLSESTADQLISNLVAEIPGTDIILINQQVISGIHTDYFKAKLLGVISMFPSKKFITDSRSYNDYYAGTIRKMNDTEAARLCGFISNPDEEIPVAGVISYARELYNRFGKPLFITCGSRGSLVADQQGIREIPGLMITSRIDSVGAGDSYLAGAASTLAAGYDIESAACMGTFVAGVTVQKLFQTGTASPKEILAIGSDPDYVYNSDLAGNSRKAVYHSGSEIEIINHSIGKPRIRHAIFDHDGTVSTLREGWEKIMAPMMIKSILGDRYNEIAEPVFNKVKVQVEEFIDNTTGIQTLVQMKGLAELIRDFGFIPEDKILNEFEYKKIYNRELLEMVQQRIGKLKNGELSVEDLTIRNAVPFLNMMYHAGIRLYLVSGTDTGDVVKEAAVLGYDGLFEGRIFGAVGDVRKEAKKEILDGILDSLESSDHCSVVTFGDGPVEIRETRKRGGLAVGIASDEVKRFGLNGHKRSRLIKAGADLVVPDFSQMIILSELLNIQ
jgi:bifunctional ADP-heptose synthase (sugar kinase/adenylyltransferase)/phosphoglycolate phosphatase-like HAD superfamily hydrolase